ncbi:MAG: hypothetical protein HY941_05805 [Gammaproteobacteria bacterium]|nr:hypothetical protein [Gammaproteobacteria bacterium]
MYSHQPRNTLRTFSLCALLAIPGLLPGLAAACGTEPCEPPPPTTTTTCLTLLKEVSSDGLKPWYDANTEAEAVTIDSTSKYRLRPTNCGDEKLINVHISDPLLAVDAYIGGLRPANDTVMEFSAAEVCVGRYGLVKNTATISGTGEISATYIEASDVAWVNCGEEPQAGQGCTPGYWKQDQHFDSWPSAYAPSTTFSSVFGRDISIRFDKQTITNPTLLQALSAQGGNINAAARHTVAALLNSASTDVDYDLSTSDVISLFQSNYPDGELDDMKDRLAKYNEQGCPLN